MDLSEAGPLRAFYYAITYNDVEKFLAIPYNILSREKLPAPSELLPAHSESTIPKNEMPSSKKRGLEDPEGEDEMRPDWRSKVKQDWRSEVKQDWRSEVKQDWRSEVKQDWRSKVKADWGCEDKEYWCR